MDQNRIIRLFSESKNRREGIKVLKSGCSKFEYLNIYQNFNANLEYSELNSCSDYKRLEGVFKKVIQIKSPVSKIKLKQIM